MKVSVLMAAYNSEATLAESIESVLASNFDDFEVICVDDMSQDRSLEILKHYSKMDERFKYIENTENLGLAASLNLAFKHCSGEYVARFDTDDICLPGRLKSQVAYLDKHSTVDVYGGAAIALNCDDVEYKIIYMPESQDDHLNLSPFATHFVHPTVMMRRSFLNDMNGYNSSLRRSEDRDLWKRGLLAGKNYANSKEPFIKYRTKNYIETWRTIWVQSIEQYSYAKRYNFSLPFLFFSRRLLRQSMVKLKLLRR